MSRILVGSNFSGFKNRIINGDFSMWQRGESFAFTAGFGGYTTDRIFTSASAGSGADISVSKTAIDNKNAVRITIDTAVASLASTYHVQGFRYMFEGSHLYDLATDGKSITLSFWFNSNVVGTYSVSLKNWTDTATNVQSYVTTFDYASANTPQKIEVTIPLDAVWYPSLVNDAAVGFVLNIGYLNQADLSTTTLNSWIGGNFYTYTSATNWGAAVGNFIEIAELQLEEGNTATQFEHIPTDIQLLRCKRYYEKYFQIFEMDYVGAAGDFRNGHLTFSVKKRAIPSVSFLNTGYSNASGIYASDISQTSLNIASTASAAGRVSLVTDVVLEAEL